MKILLNSGVIKYINILFILSLFFAFFSILVGFVCFIFFLITFASIYLVSYLFRMEDRILNNKSSIVSPTDGRVIEVKNISVLPDIIDKYTSYKIPYNMVMVESNISTIYFKYSPIDCKIEDIQIYTPRTINKNSNFKHKNYRTYIVFKLIKENNNIQSSKEEDNLEEETIFIINEVLFGDRNHDMYKLYVNIGDRVKKGDLLICNHFYSLIWIYLPYEDLSIQRGQSLFYQETSLVFDYLKKN